MELQWTQCPGPRVTPLKGEWSAFTREDLKGETQLSLLHGATEGCVFVCFALFPVEAVAMGFHLHLLQKPTMRTDPHLFLKHSASPPGLEEVLKLGMWLPGQTILQPFPN